MTLRRKKKDTSLTFKNDRQLKPFMLTDAIPTGKLLGTGSYGSVEEVSYQHLVCAGKMLHDSLIDIENSGVAEVIRKYLKECQLMSSLHHPNITQFLGLCFLPKSQLPVLVMERLETSLDDLLETIPNLPLSLKMSILKDVANGLLYLHGRQPPVIHRDLTSKNVLLTSSLVAKITDLGNSRIIDLKSSQYLKTMTKYPGTLVYMPPEVQDDRHSYGTSMDIFSFGHLALYTITQKFPGDLLPSTYLEPGNKQEVLARTEIERRADYIELLDSKVGSDHPSLVELVKQCLHNATNQRPNTEDLVTKLQDIKLKVEGEFGSGSIKLDLVKLRLKKEVKEKDKKIKELTLKMAKREPELEVMRSRLQESSKHQLEEKVGEVKKLQAESKFKDAQIHTLQNDVANKDSQIKELQQKLKKFQNRLKRISEEFDIDDTPKEADSTATTPKQETKVWEINMQQVELTKKLSADEFSEVWKGVWNNSTPVTVKSLKPRTAKSTSEFLQEAEALKHLRHPNIIELYSVCSSDQPISIITEPQSSFGSLQDYLRDDGKSLKHPELIGMSRQIAEGMAYIESKDYVHRYLTANSVLFTDQKVCKIADFERACKVTNGESVYTPNTKFLMKWTAPEALQDQHFTIKSDVWSFGIVLYEIFTYGRMPYPGLTNIEVSEKVQTGYRMPSPPNTPPKLYEIMSLCWQKNPDDRPTFDALKWQMSESYILEQNYCEVKHGATKEKTKQQQQPKKESKLAKLFRS